ncbi:MAG: hypothetical protein R3A78_02050 [Polyangiales bacterium]
MTRWVSALTGAVLVLCVVARAHAQQFDLVDVEYEHTLANYSYQVSHYRVTPAGTVPSDLSNPVDYEHGTLHFRVEVLDMASANGLRWQTAFEQAPYYECGPSLSLTGPGVFEADRAIDSLDCAMAGYDWGAPPAKLAFILRDSAGKKIDIGQGFIGEPDQSLYLPFHARVTVTVVAAGATYVPPAGDAGVDAGMDAAIGDADVPLDAGVWVDSGVDGRDGGPSTSAPKSSSQSSGVGGGCAMASSARHASHWPWIGALPGAAVAVYRRRRRARTS